MDRLNYHHLLYFWTIVREGGVARAAQKLRLAQPTVSGQIRVLEGALGEKLFERSGRRLVTTEVGKLVFRYADEIFGLGQELTDVLRGRPAGRPVRLAVGIADVVPKIVAHRLLEPALQMPEPVRLEVREDTHERLLAELALHHLDLVLTDAPVGPSTRVRAFNHLLGETAVDLFAVPRLAARLRSGFPRSLDGAPMLLPAPETALRRALEAWFESLGVRPRVVAEFDDSALLKVFGQRGAGVLAAPAAIAAEIRSMHGLMSLGRAGRIREHYYAISVERRLQHPAVLAISDSARRRLFK